MNFTFISLGWYTVIGLRSDPADSLRSASRRRIFGKSGIRAGVRTQYILWFGNELLAVAWNTNRY